MAHAQYTIIDCMSSNTYFPKEFMESVNVLWSNYELGNDWFYIPANYVCEYDSSTDQWEAVDEYKPILDYLLKEGLDPDKTLIHYWW